MPGQPLNSGSGTLRANYLALTAAFVTVAAGSAGATLLAMSLMSADAPELAIGAADVVVANVVAAEPITDSASAGQAVAKTETSVPAVAQAQRPDAAAMQEIAGLATEEAVAALESSDPRWAQFAKPAPPLEDLRNDGRSDVSAAFGAAGHAGGGALAAVKRAIQEPDEDPGQDTQETAAITPPARVAEPKSNAGGRQIVLNTAANVRSRANKSGKVLGAIPAGVKVTGFGCSSSWCEVSYKGLRGWVYSGFVSGSAQAKNSGESNVKATQASAQRPKIQASSVAKAKNDGGLPGVKANEPLPTVQKLDKSGK